MRDRKEIEDEMYKAGDLAMKGSKFPGMSYEEGVEAALRWALGDEDTPPTEG